jgi:EF hand
MSTLFNTFTTDMMARPLTQDKVFTTTAFETTFKRADSNQDGQLTREELNSLIVSDARYVDVDYQAASVLQNNFAGIANRARKQGEPEIATFAYDPTVDTINIKEIRQLAAFDGNSDNITKSDVRLLANHNVSYWPQVPVGTTPPVVTPAPGTPSPQNPFQKLLQLFVLLLLFGGGRFGGRGW